MKKIIKISIEKDKIFKLLLNQLNTPRDKKVDYYIPHGFFTIRGEEVIDYDLDILPPIKKEEFHINYNGNMTYNIRETIQRMLDEQNDILVDIKVDIKSLVKEANFSARGFSVALILIGDVEVRMTYSKDLHIKINRTSINRPIT